MITLQEICRGPESEKEVQNLMYDKLEPHCHPFEARQYAWQLQSKGYGVDFEVYTSPDGKGVIIKYESALFHGLPGNIDFLGGAKLQRI